MMFATKQLYILCYAVSLGLHINELLQERFNSIANALELHIFLH